ncbi:Signal transduction histidine kinase CheA [hydrothermal vent metagenome]|uniref:Signal transduction histidine kinase CheA n=1 Tax=hydrothermal vent metagenome TaxID=652676 RepID=A0A3B1C9A4_9ZZZZ
MMMVGLNELGSFVHEIEAILDQARSGALEITSEITDILLDATDVIKDAKKSIVKGAPPEISKSLLKSVEKFQEPKEVEAVEVIDVHQRTFHLGSLERFNLMANRHTGYSVYQLFLSFKPEFQHAFLVALLILKRISKIGNIFGTVPSIEEIENQNIEKQLKIMFSSQLDNKGLEKFIEDVLVKYYDVTEFEILKTF